MKQCALCRSIKPLDEFHRRAKSLDGRQRACIQCGKDALAEFRKTNPPKKGGPKPIDPIERAIRKKITRKRDYEKNKAARLAVAATYRKANKERESINRKGHYLRNKEHVAKVTKAYREAHPELYAAAFAKRRASKRNATPKWADFDKISEFYKEARRLTVETGIPHEVDHFYPLQSKFVCGLHVPENLRVITQFANRSRGNRFEP